jgi:hypothetical protein
MVLSQMFGMFYFYTISKNPILLLNFFYSCPHCGLRIPSTNAFTYHWRAHHRASLCSLCVNLYRVKYGIKENDLHDLISKSMLQLLNEELDVNKPKPVIQIHSNLSQDLSGNKIIKSFNVIILWMFYLIKILLQMNPL